MKEILMAGRFDVLLDLELLESERRVRTILFSIGLAFPSILKLVC